jgi:hypothetical protein
MKKTRSKKSRDTVPLRVEDRKVGKKILGEEVKGECRECWANEELWKVVKQWIRRKARLKKI